MRIQYEILAVEVSKLYPPHYTLKSNETIDQHLMDIETFIRSCGWSVEEYMEEYIHRGVMDVNSN